MIHMAPRSVTTNNHTIYEDAEVEKTRPEVYREEEDVEKQPILLPQSCTTEDEEKVWMLPLKPFWHTIQICNLSALKEMKKKAYKY